MVPRRMAVLTLAALGLVAGTFPSQAAANKGMTISPDFGATLTGAPSFSVPGPGCNTATANATVVTLSGPGVTATNTDGSSNITGAVPWPSGAISMSTGGVSWDGVAQAKALPRPLNGTYTVKVQCLSDGDPTGENFFDRDVVFVGAGAAGSPGAWQAAGQPTPPGTPAPGTRGFVLHVPGTDTCPAVTSLSQPGCGLFTLSVPTAPDAEFAPLVFGRAGADTFLTTSAPIAPVSVTDTRPGALPWRLSGQLSTFTTPTGSSVSARYAGWEPQIVSNGAGAIVGDVVPAGYPTGDGLNIARLLASADLGHGGRLAPGASMAGRLVVRLPLTVGGGDYRTVLTLTLMS